MTPDRSIAVVLPDEIRETGVVSLLGYQRAVHATDRLPARDLSTPVLGLFGEVGSLLAVIKKRRRDATVEPAYQKAFIEELGDVLWYLTCIADRAGLDLSLLAQRVSRGIADWDETGADEFGSWADLEVSSSRPDDVGLSSSALALASFTGELTNAFGAGRLQENRDRLTGHLVDVLRQVIATAGAADISLDAAARHNLEKVFSRYPISAVYPPLVDDGRPEAERLPRSLDVHIIEHAVGGKLFVSQMCNGRAVGDRLTDNKMEADDYRFHDVFHLAYAVHLGWSPTLRGLLRVKRRSDSRLDENEDGARAVLTEEGVATFVFGRALERNLFEGLDRLDLDLLKLVHGLVRGFEAERCALWQWERAILDGFKVFRELKKHRQGHIRADLLQHTIEFSTVLDGPRA